MKPVNNRLLVEPIDLDLIDNTADVYLQAQNTIKYLKNFIDSIDARVKSGEFIDGLLLVDGNRNRFITELGEKVLHKALGDKIYSQKLIGITELENLVGKEKMDEYAELGVIDYKTPAKKVIVLEKK